MKYISLFSFPRSTTVKAFLIISLALCSTAAFGFQHTLSKKAMSAASANRAAAQTGPSVVGQWSNPMPWPVVAIHMHTLPNGKVLAWQRKDSDLTTQTYLWDPANPAAGFIPIFNPYTHLFCSGHSFLPDGRLLVTGGHHFLDGDGEPHTNIFDYATNTWNRNPADDMNAGRWYPTNTTLANGEVLTVSGIYWDGTLAPTIAIVTCDNSYDLYFNGSYRGSGANWSQAQTYTLPMQLGKNVLAIKCSDAGGVAGLLAELKIGGGITGSNASWKVSRTAPANWTDINFDDSGWANATEYGSYGIGPWGTAVNGMPPNTPAKWIWSSNNDADSIVYVRVSFDDKGSHNHVNNTLPQVWQTANNGGWRWLVSAPQGMSLYPWMLLAPDGRVFNSGPQKQTRFLNTTGVGSWANGPLSDPTGDPLDEIRGAGSSVMYDDGKVLIVGGGSPPTNTAQILDLNVPGSGWQPTGSMTYARRQLNATILPDGKVLVTGGTSGAGFNNAVGSVLAAEMWDPTTGAWSTLASMKVRRLYHSTAVLLADGRVLSAGGGMPAGEGGDTDHADAEIYSPPYLFKGARPTITSAPAYVKYGQTFFVQTPNATAISKVTWIRLSSVTHTFNQNQRINRLSFSQAMGGLNVTAPSNRNLCPPGDYMLFILNSLDVPSVAKVIKVADPSYEGYVDGANCSQIWGWAWDKNIRNSPINVDIYDGNFLIATVPANLFRQDLVNAGKGNGNHAFVFNIPPGLKNGQIHSLGVRFGGAINPLNWSPRSIACGATIFTSQTPASFESGAGATWEESTQFSSSMEGKITAIRFYKAPGETGTHVGRIWSDTGALLAQVTFSNESASGWQEQPLPTPLQITAGIRYRVSYNINLYLAKIFAGLNTPITNGPLTGHTSFYSTPAGTFPNTNSGSVFFADVRFSAP